MLLSQQHCCRPRCRRNSDCAILWSLSSTDIILFPNTTSQFLCLYLESLRHSIVGIVSSFLRHHSSPLLFDAVIIILPSQSTIKSDRRLRTRTIVYHTILDFNSCLFVEQCCRILHVEKYYHQFTVSFDWAISSSTCIHRRCAALSTTLLLAATAIQPQ